MNEIFLPGRPRPVSQLGFGTAGFGRRLSRRQRLRLLEEAFALGITYVDTAPLYGRGTAEDAVGRFLVGRRDGVAVGTKLGLEWDRGVRRRSVRRFDVASAARRLDASLRALRSERVDVLLVHEPRPEDVTDELIAFLLDAVERGRAGAVGVAASGAIDAAPPALAVLQTALSQLDSLPRDRFTIVHSALVGTGDAPAALRDAVRRNANGIVLFGTSDPDHLRANVSAVEA